MEYVETRHSSIIGLREKSQFHSAYAIFLDVYRTFNILCIIEGNTYITGPMARF